MPVFALKTPPPLHLQISLDDLHQYKNPKLLSSYQDCHG